MLLLQSPLGRDSDGVNTQVEGDGNTVINNPTTPTQPEPTRTKHDPVTLFGKQLKTRWIGITGIVAFLAGIATIYITLKPLFQGALFDKGHPSSIFMSYLLVILMLIMIGALYLRQVFKSSVLIISKYKIASHQGELYFEEYEATCPNCGSKLKPVSFKGVSYMRCKLYSEHTFRFNPKLFDEESYQ